jgi:hypothetical protein
MASLSNNSSDIFNLADNFFNLRDLNNDLTILNYLLAFFIVQPIFYKIKQLRDEQGSMRLKDEH